MDTATFLATLSDEEVAAIGVGALRNVGLAVDIYALIDVYGSQEKAGRALRETIVDRKGSLRHDVVKWDNALGHQLSVYGPPHHLTHLLRLFGLADFVERVTS